MSQPPASSDRAIENGVRTTQVWFVQGKAANKAFRSALQLHRENATVGENKENIPPETHDDQKGDPEHDQSQKT